jgi:hypothetical protein
MSLARAASRAVRAVFLCTAPTVGQGNRGVTGQGLRLACAEPGDQLAIFGEARRELTERAAYLYEDAGRYWFATQPKLNRLADDHARAFELHEVDVEIVAMLNEEARTAGGFRRVFAISLGKLFGKASLKSRTSARLRSARAWRPTAFR